MSAILLSHSRSPKPSSLLALLCLSIVARVRPDWVAVSIREAASAEGVSAERVSRLTTRVLGPFESLVGRLTRIGRPEKTGDEQGEELALTRSLLSVATSLLEHVRPRKTAQRALIVGAYSRLREEYPALTQARFCGAICLPERTLRSWLEKPLPSDIRSSKSVADDSRPPRRPRPPRRGRFDFAVILPGVQFAADTTDLCAFGVPLKLIATQDLGGRDQSLLDTIIVDDHESADIVVDVLEKTLADRPGAQLISDQGTPYLADATRAALEDLEVEHAVQKEGDPLGKSPTERAFGTVKCIAAPILQLTERIASIIQPLSHPGLAIAFTTLLLTALLRAYQAGARASRRASNQRAIAPEELLRLAQVSRERARAESRSTRLSSERIYHDYNIGGSQKAFVRSCRRFPSSVLLQAERLFSTQAHRDDIRNRASYFLHLANQVNIEHHRKQARNRHEMEQAERIRLYDQHVVAERAQWHADPIAWLRDTLELLALSWTGTELFADGRGVRSCLHHACIRLFQVHGTMAYDIIAGLWRSFEHTHLSDIGPSGLSAVKAVLQLHLQGIPKPEPTPSRAANFVATILPSGPTTRPPPSSRPC